MGGKREQIKKKILKVYMFFFQYNRNIYIFANASVMDEDDTRLERMKQRYKTLKARLENAIMQGDDKRRVRIQDRLRGYEHLIKGGGDRQKIFDSKRAWEMIN